MRVMIDGDGCPVAFEAAEICKKMDVECIIVCDTSHVLNIDGIETVVVEKGADSADFKIVNMINKGDVVITQDYALAAMCLARGSFAINQDGKEYNEKNIDGLLFSRYTAKKIRNAGGRLKGPHKRTNEQTELFKTNFSAMLERGFQCKN